MVAELGVVHGCGAGRRAVQSGDGQRERLSSSASCWRSSGGRGPTPGAHLDRREVAPAVGVGHRTSTDDLAVVQVAEGRVGLELEEHVVQPRGSTRTTSVASSLRCDGSWERTSSSSSHQAKNGASHARLAAHPGVAHRVDVDQQAPEVLGGGQVDGEDLPRRVEGLVRIRVVGRCAGRRRGEDVLDREAGAVRQLGDRVGERLEDRDARVVGVVVGPLRAAGLLDVADALAAQPVEVLGGRQLGGRHGSGHECHQVTAGRTRSARGRRPRRGGSGGRRAGRTQTRGWRSPGSGHLLQVGAVGDDAGVGGTGGRHSRSRRRPLLDEVDQHRLVDLAVEGRASVAAERPRRKELGDLPLELVLVGSRRRRRGTAPADRRAPPRTGGCGRAAWRSTTPARRRTARSRSTRRLVNGRSGSRASAPSGRGSSRR